MKHLVLAFLLSLVATTSHAVVTDQFLCKTTLIDEVSGVSSEQTQDLSLVRLPTSGGTTQPYDETLAGTTINLKSISSNSSIETNVRFFYRHAIRKIPGSSELEARQSSCIGIAFQFCDKTEGGRPCNDENLQVTCVKTPPFDPVKGWKKTPVIDGVPRFNDSELGPARAEIKSHNGRSIANVILDCKFLGTYK